MGQSLSSSITVVENHADRQVLHLNIYYHTTLRVIDSNNTFTVTGNFPNQSGPVSINAGTPSGGGGQQWIYSKALTVNKVFGSTTTVSGSASLRGIDFWGAGQVISTSASHTVPARTPVAPSAPGTPTVSSITSSTARASWTASSNTGGAAIRNYQMQLARNSSFTTGLSTVETKSGSIRHFDITGMTRATTYYLRVRSHNGTAWSPWSGTRSFKSAPVPPTVANTHSVINITRNSGTITGISVSDNGGEAPSDLRVQHNSSASTSGASVVTRGAWAQVTISGLPADAVRYYRVAAYNSAGWGSYGAWQSFRTLADAPDDMSTPTLSVLSNTAIRVIWSAPNMNGATFQQYRVEISLTSDFSNVVASATTTGLQRDFTGLLPGTRYYVRVRAEATPNNSGWGGAEVTTTGRAPNSGLRLFTFVNGVRRELTAYTFASGSRRQVRVMVQHDGAMRTE